MEKGFVYIVNHWFGFINQQGFPPERYADSAKYSWNVGEIQMSLSLEDTKLKLHYENYPKRSKT